MKPGVRFLRAGAFAFALALDGTAAARAEHVLYAGSGGWGAVSGVPESASPPGADWVFEDGLWVGRIPADAEQLAEAGSLIGAVVNAEHRAELVTLYEQRATEMEVA